MKFIPILFNSDMVNAILENRKNQTRREIKPQPALTPSGYIYKGAAYGIGFNERETANNFIKGASKYQVGDIIWVRETTKVGAWDHEDYKVAFDYKASPELKKTPWCYFEDVEKFEKIQEKSIEALDLLGIEPIVDEVNEEFPQAVTVTGRDSMEQKQQNIDAFQNNQNVKLIVCNIKAAGVGITLTASSRVAFIEYPWTYADCVQCEDRAHRIGQVNNVMCTYFLGQKTIDEQLFEMIQSKAETANAITGATDEMKTDFIDNVMDLFKS